MKQIKNLIAMICAFCIALGVSGCTKVDDMYGVESELSDAESAVTKVEKDPNYDYPEIVSEDRVVSNYIDISKYDEENYADIYLGKRFDIEAVYDGLKVSVPTTYEKLVDNGWELTEGNKYDAESTIFSRETVKTEFVNQNGKKLTVYFYNSKSSSKKLSKCYAVRFKVENNCLFTDDSEYAMFNVNDIMNSSAITDVVDVLGDPSHFYAVSESEYYFDYFISEKDRRNGITVYMDIDEDTVTAIEWSYYK